MHGVCCGLGGFDGSRINWSTLGQDALGQDEGYTTDISEISTADLGLPGGILDPSAPSVTVGQISDFINTGSADPSVIDQISAIVKAAGPTITGIMQQYQFGQLSANTPINQLPMLRAAVTGQAPSMLSASLLSNPAVLIGGAVLLFVLLKKGK